MYFSRKDSYRLCDLVCKALDGTWFICRLLDGVSIYFGEKVLFMIGAGGLGD